MGGVLDSALMARLREVLDRRPVTEAELRKLTEEGRAWAMLVNAQLERSKQRLDELAGDPGAPLADVADALPEVDELHALLAELQGRAREFRQSWVSR